MSRKRRRTIDRNPFHRVMLWDRKLEPETYAIYLTRVKDLAREKFEYYQVVHEFLIKLVREVLSHYPEESHRMHAYMWYAQGLWYIIQRYGKPTGSPAMQIEVDSLYLYFLSLGLKDLPMRAIAQRMGVTISKKEEIAVRIGVYIPYAIVEFPWGLPIVIVGKTVRFYLTAERAGLAISVVVTKPDGSKQTLSVIDLGDGNYAVDVYFDQEGVWILEAIFPDGFKLKREVYAVRGVSK